MREWVDARSLFFWEFENSVCTRTLVFYGLCGQLIKQLARSLLSLDGSDHEVYPAIFFALSCIGVILRERSSISR